MILLCLRIVTELIHRCVCVITKLKNLAKFNCIIFLFSLFVFFYLYYTVSINQSKNLINTRKNQLALSYTNDRLRKYENIKYILLWTPDYVEPFYYFGKGRQGFLNRKCPITNCYVTSNRSLFDDITKFDVVAFNGRSLPGYSIKDFPKARSAHQKYLYVTMESSDNDPICDDHFNNIFNWTATYKLTSDIPFSYFLFRDKKGTILGPKPDMNWEATLKEEHFVEQNRSLEYLPDLKEKTKTAAWFVSNCNARSSRQKYANELQEALKHHDLNLDIYGNCGTLKCPRTYEKFCDAFLGRHYFFYLAFENSFAEDYVTEKLLRALKHNMIPIVLGGANYSRFLPPKSYLNALEYTPEQLAEVMAAIVRSPQLYMQYFEWKKYYTYEDAMPRNMCSLCEALNYRTMVETTTVYTDLKKWWNGPIFNRCR